LRSGRPSVHGWMDAIPKLVSRRMAVIAVVAALASAGGCSAGALSGSSPTKASPSVKTVTITFPPPRRLTALQRAGLMQIRPVLAIYEGADARRIGIRPTCTYACSDRVLAHSHRLVLEAVTDRGWHPRFVLGPVIADGRDVVHAKFSSRFRYSPYVYVSIRGGGGAIAYRLAPEAAVRIAALRAAELARPNGAPDLQLAIVFDGRIMSVEPFTEGPGGSGIIPLPFAYLADVQFAAWLMGRRA
jgi:hypothetical protein